MAQRSAADVEPSIRERRKPSLGVRSIAEVFNFGTRIGTSSRSLAFATQTSEST
jgi:hypothetical protein